MKSSSRSYTDRTLKILWGRSAGRCAMPSCRVELLLDQTDYDPVVVIGDAAHMVASSEDGPRGDPTIVAQGRDVYDNLILLCKNCHARIDGQPISNPVPYLNKIKSDHEAWVRSCLPECGDNTHGWIPLIVQGDHPIDASGAMEALSPEIVSTDPSFLTLSYSTDWTQALATIRSTVSCLFQQSDPFNKRIAAFAIAPVSACIATGYVLTNRPKVRVFQYQRASGSWAWLQGPAPIEEIVVEGLPTSNGSAACAIAICFHLSANIALADLPSAFADGLNVVHCRIPVPSIHWLKNEIQVEQFTHLVSELFGRLPELFPNADKWHLFYAGPAPTAIRVGQQLNPTMSPQVQLYEFNRSANPRYAPSILLEPYRV
jgi:hypothetical protein